MGRCILSRTSLVIRSLFLLGFVVAMPLLALPSVARRLDEWLYGQKDSSPPDEEWIKRDGDGSAEGAVVHTTFETPLTASIGTRADGGGEHGLDAAAGRPPDLAPAPDFRSPQEVTPDSASLAGGPAGAPIPPADLPFPPEGFQPQSPPGEVGSVESGVSASTYKRLGEIRQRLEDLGADYILLEAVGDTSIHRFQCRMLVAADAAETKSFEASGKDAVAVAEQVLSSVEKWRASQTSGP